MSTQYPTPDVPVPPKVLAFRPEVKWRKIPRTSDVWISEFADVVSESGQQYLGAYDGHGNYIVVCQKSKSKVQRRARAVLAEVFLGRSEGDKYTYFKSNTVTPKLQAANLDWRRARRKRTDAKAVEETKQRFRTLGARWSALRIAGMSTGMIAIIDGVTKSAVCGVTHRFQKRLGIRLPSVPNKAAEKAEQIKRAREAARFGIWAIFPELKPDYDNALCEILAKQREVDQ